MVTTIYSLMYDFFFYQSQHKKKPTIPTHERLHTHTHTHTQTPHPRSPPQRRPGSLSTRRETLDEGKGNGAAAGLRNFPRENPRNVAEKIHPPLEYHDLATNPHPHNPSHIYTNHLINIILHNQAE